MVILPNTLEIDIEGEPFILQELSAREAFAVWDMLAEAEATGHKLEAYLTVVSLGLRTMAGTRVFGQDDLEELARWPSRIVVPLAERILAMSEVEMDPGKGSGGAESSASVSPEPSVIRIQGNSLGNSR